MTDFVPEEIELDKEAFGIAIDQANEASHAGLDNQEQLEHAIKAYLWSLGERGKLGRI